MFDAVKDFRVFLGGEVHFKVLIPRRGLVKRQQLHLVLFSLRQLLLPALFCYLLCCLELALALLVESIGFESETQLRDSGESAIVLIKHVHVGLILLPLGWLEGFSRVICLFLPVLVHVEFIYFADVGRVVLHAVGANRLLVNLLRH